MKIKHILLGALLLLAFISGSRTVSAAENFSCSDLYAPNSVQAVLFSPVPGAVSGTTYPLTALVKNYNAYPVVDGDLYVRILKLNDKALGIAGGYSVVDQFSAAQHIDLAAGTSTQLAFTWRVPTYALSGDYQVVPYFVSNGRFDMLGDPARDSIHGVPFAFSVSGDATTGVAFDPKSVETSSTTIQATLVNSTAEQQTVSVTAHIYRSNAVDPQNELKTIPLRATLAPHESKKLSFIVSDQVATVFTVIEADYHDAKSIVNVRFDRPNLERDSIGFASVAGYPIVAGEQASYFACVNRGSVANAGETPRLTLTLSDGQGNVLDTHEYPGAGTGSLTGYKATFASKAPQSDLRLRADLYNGPSLVDSVTVPYACAALDPALCGSTKWPTTADQYEIVAVAALLVALSVWVVTRKKNTGSMIAMIAFVIVAGGVSIMPSRASAATVSSVYGNIVYGYQNMTCTTQSSPVSTVEMPADGTFQSCSYNYDQNNIYTGGEPRSSYDPATGICTAWFVCDGGTFGGACPYSGWCSDYVVQARIDYTAASKPPLNPSNETANPPVVAGDSSVNTDVDGHYTVSGSGVFSGDSIEYEISFGDLNGSPSVDQIVPGISFAKSSWMSSVSAATAPSGAFSKSWATPGNKTIKARTIDITLANAAGGDRSVGASAWSAPFPVTVTQVPQPPVDRTISVQITGTGSGRVTGTPGNINCASDMSGTCSATVSDGTTVTLTASAAPGSTFAGWSGPCSGTGSCSVKVIGPTTVAATFTAPPAVSATGISTTLSLNKSQATAGDSAVATSIANGTGVRYHGLEGRYATAGGSYGAWQNWGIWCQNDPSCPTGVPVTQNPTFGQPGMYELRSYAAGADGVSVQSSSAFVSVTAAPVVTPPVQNTTPTGNTTGAGNPGNSGNPGNASPQPSPSFSLSADPATVNARSAAGYSGAIEKEVHISVNPVAGFGSTVTMTVDQGSIPAGIKPEFSFDGGATYSSNPSADMTWDGSNYYRNASGLVYLPVRIRFSGPLQQNATYPITFTGTGGGQSAQTTVNVVSVPVAPNFQER